MDRARMVEILGDLMALETEANSTLEADAQAIGTAASQVGLSWSGSALGHHAEMYYERFQRPPHGCQFNAERGTQMGWPHGWVTPPVGEIEAEIRRISGVDLTSWKERYPRRSEAEKLVAAIRGAQRERIIHDSNVRRLVVINTDRWIKSNVQGDRSVRRHHLGQGIPWHLGSSAKYQCRFDRL